VSDKDLEKIGIGTIVPDVKRAKLVSIYDNFKGFLEFYSETGKFQKERRVIYLLKR